MIKYVGDLYHHQIISKWSQKTSGVGPQIPPETGNLSGQITIDDALLVGESTGIDG